MKFLILLILLVTLIVVVLGALSVYEAAQRRAKKARIAKPTRPELGVYKQEDVTWLYAQGLSKEEIEILIRQNQGMK